MKFKRIMVAVGFGLAVFTAGPVALA